jgi:Ca2+-binding EF-hand superfamily protein
MTFHLITQEETTKLMKTFESLDVNHDQRLTKEEILNGLQKKFGDEKKAKEFVDEIFAKLDEDGNGDIDYRGILPFLTIC